jgi:uncharacterized protein with PQ loop repeat
MFNYDIVGYLGTFLITINLIPQIYLIYKTKNVENISIYFIVIGLMSGIVMGTYGILIKKIPVIIANSSIAFFYCIILALKHAYNIENKV